MSINQGIDRSLVVVLVKNRRVAAAAFSSHSSADRTARSSLI
jgi:hypothetical protein